jgi:hypothetical protein
MKISEVLERSASIAESYLLGGPYQEGEYLIRAMDDATEDKAERASAWIYLNGYFEGVTIASGIEKVIALQFAALMSKDEGL